MNGIFLSQRRLRFVTEPRYQRPKVMFDESQPTPKAAKGRMAASLLGSVVLYGTLASVVLAATAAVKHAVTEDKMVQIDFVPPPLPELEEAPPPPPPPQKKGKKRGKGPPTPGEGGRDEPRPT
ncbi:MAG: hypothetical protein KC416_17350, partial [Myxococcales bacterium]|nr:hypothetical protein [Myxococcales bacterium]